MRAAIQGPVPRLVVIGLILLGVQNAVAAQHPIADVRVQVLLALVVAAGVSSGAERGALAGFVLGMMYDLSSGQPLGQTALAYGLAGLVAGYLQVLTPVPRWWMLAGFTVLGAVAGEAAVPFVKLVTGQEGWVSSELLRIVTVVSLSSVILLPVLLPIGRWVVALRRPQWKVLPE